MDQELPVTLYFGAGFKYTTDLIFQVLGSQIYNSLYDLGRLRWIKMYLRLYILVLIVD